MKKNQLLNYDVQKIVTVPIYKLNNLLKENGFPNDYIKYKHQEENSDSYKISTVLSDNTPISTKLSKILNIKIWDMKWSHYDNVEIIFD